MEVVCSHNAVQGFPKAGISRQSCTKINMAVLTCTERCPVVLFAVPIYGSNCNMDKCVEYFYFLSSQAESCFLRGEAPALRKTVLLPGVVYMLFVLLISGLLFPTHERDDTPPGG